MPHALNTRRRFLKPKPGVSDQWVGDMTSYTSLTSIDPYILMLPYLNDGVENVLAPGGWGLEHVG